MPGMTATGAALPSPVREPRPIAGALGAEGAEGAAGALGAAGAFGAAGTAGMAGARGALGAEGADGAAGGARLTGAGGGAAGFGFGGISWRYCKAERNQQACKDEENGRVRTFDGAQPSCEPFLMSHHPPSSFVTTSRMSSFFSGSSPGWSVSNAKRLRATEVSVLIWTQNAGIGTHALYCSTSGSGRGGGGAGARVGGGGAVRPVETGAAFAAGA